MVWFEILSTYLHKMIPKCLLIGEYLFLDGTQRWIMILKLKMNMNYDWLVEIHDIINIQLFTFQCYQGFLNLRFVPWVRNLLTRTVAIGPSLIAALIGGSSGAGNLIIISSVIFTPPNLVFFVLSHLALVLTP